jgi:hypothetical protein
MSVPYVALQQSVLSLSYQNLYEFSKPTFWAVLLHPFIHGKMNGADISTNSNSQNPYVDH